MTTTPPHLTEADRQMLSDGSASAELRHELESHVRGCEACARDVARLRLVVRRFSEPPIIELPLEALWPEIRSRIVRGNVIPLASSAAPSLSRWSAARPIRLVVALAAAVAIAAPIFTRVRRDSLDRVRAAALDRGGDAGIAVSLAADSARSYEEEAQALLNRLELQRAMIRPDAMASIERDLRVIDAAIDELKRAIANDPRNPALRQLLASSYRQKVELLKRAGNAG